jgi:hypothetical protein
MELAYPRCLECHGVIRTVCVIHERGMSHDREAHEFT